VKNNKSGLDVDIATVGMGVYWKERVRVWKNEARRCLIPFLNAVCPEIPNEKIAFRFKANEADDELRRSYLASSDLISLEKT